MGVVPTTPSPQPRQAGIQAVPVQQAAARQFAFPETQTPTPRRDPGEILNLANDPSAFGESLDETDFGDPFPTNGLL